MNIYLLAAASGYFVAESCKFLLKFVKDRHAKQKWRWLGQSGDMPSSHAATVTALATSIFLADGFASATFAIAAVFAVVTIHDATRVRRATGEQGSTINLLLDKVLPGQAKPYFAKGHTPWEVAIGSSLGALAGLLAYSLF